TRLNTFAKAEMVRIIQEALNNIRRHAEAKNVKIIFKRRNGSLKVEITDDGKGFAPEEVFDSGKRRRNFGVRSMKGRALRLGGRFNIMSQPRKGTTVQVEVPLQEEAT
ncbi:MAG: ATP-binding protein, partial [Actinomycetota bacterium]